jgi:NADH-quinone oxidoreductase subunit J
MIIYGLLFYIFSLMTIISSVIVVSSKNNIYSALWLIMAFFNGSGLFLLLGAEFISMLMIIVYVGAVMVLFLFVVMTTHNKLLIKNIFGKYSFLCILLAIFMVIDLYVAYDTTLNQSRFLLSAPSIPIPDTSIISNTQAIGMILYTDYLLPFIIAAIILFIAMIGAIVITIKNHKTISIKQDINKQVKRKRSESVKIAKVDFFKGIE